ncbi:MAG: hypothetical protein CMF22_10345 [Idiomarinaceae bacterium]|nr:hypothetical protein [Idiomarinaceae bacterium]MBG23840.1 hypothetical protein [Idiomarinaceae bacterium]|tara:strand:+ start:26077 stop:26418 length:342 start_codon:yes stop_codon:yes gene_type:complete
MTNSELFRKAHAMTRATIQDGDDYAATFAVCLKLAKRTQADPIVWKLDKSQFVFDMTISVFLIACLTVLIFFTFAWISGTIAATIASGIIGSLVLFFQTMENLEVNTTAFSGK